MGVINRECRDCRKGLNMERFEPTIMLKDLTKGYIIQAEGIIGCNLSVAAGIWSNIIF